MASTNETEALYEAGSIWKFLDKLSLSNPEAYKQYIQKVLKEGEQLDLGPPLAKFAVETYKTPKVIPERKYFINIGEWKQVPKPASKNGAVPILASEPRKELIDKEWAMLIDIVLNPVLFAECRNDLEKCSIIELVLNYIENKNAFKLSRKYKFLDGSYIGNKDCLLNFMLPTSLQKSLDTAVNSKLTSESVIDKIQLPDENRDRSKKIDKLPDMGLSGKNHVRDEKEKINKCPEKGDKTGTRPSVPFAKTMDPIITANLNSPVLTEQNTKSIKNAKKSKLKRPKVEMEVDKEEERVELTIYLPNVESVTECDLELSENHLSLTVFDKYELELDLPLYIDIDASKAKFVKDLMLLRVTANIIPPISS